MWPDRLSNPGPLTYESGALPTAICGPAADIYRLLGLFANRKRSNITLSCLYVLL